MKSLWAELKNDDEATKYFPDSCHRKPPPRTFFWQVYAIVRPQQFKALVQNQVEMLKLRKRVKDDRVAVTAEGADIFDNFKFEDDIRLLGMIMS